MQSNVPGQLITSSYPCFGFLDLFRAHHPRWFLPRYKIWFSDTGLPGRMIVTRYDPRRGCIEGYQLVGRNRDTSHQRWEADNTTVILGFRPDIRLHLDSPVLRLPAYSPNDSYRAEDPFASFSPHRSASDATGEASRATSSTPKWRFQTEIRMQLNLMNRLQSSFVHARRLLPTDLTTRPRTKFPYSHIWPPPTIPSADHVLGAGLDRSTSLRPTDHATRISETTDLAFRIYKWIQIHDDDPGPSTAELLTPPPPSPSRLLAIGEEVSTYTTLAPDLYTPTPSHPFRGIWIGDYGSHGCEFLWLRQPDVSPSPQQQDRVEGESDAAYAARMREPVYSGRLEGVKLTGDANVPRGEVTFVVEELGDGGVVGVGEHKPFEGVRIVRSRGHIADNGFSAGESFCCFPPFPSFPFLSIFVFFFFNLPIPPYLCLLFFFSPFV